MAHPDNRFYGHSGVLASWAGVHDRVPVLRGHVQHGWSPGWPGSQKQRLAPWLPLFTWTPEAARDARRMGFRWAEAIGAPFLYLIGSLGDPHIPTDGSVIAFPFHQTDRESPVGSHTEYANHLQATSVGPVVVSLYPADFAAPRVRSSYEERGFSLVCHGHRSDPGFLCALYTSLARADRVVSNRLCTAIWYGAALGREVAVDGPVFGASGWSSEALSAWDRDAGPEIFAERLRGDAAIEVAGPHLGASSVRQPAELSEMLGLGRTQAVSWLLRAAVHADHHARTARFWMGRVSTREGRRQLAEVIRHAAGSRGHL